MTAKQAASNNITTVEGRAESDLYIQQNFLDTYLGMPAHKVGSRDYRLDPLLPGPSASDSDAWVTWPRASGSSIPPARPFVCLPRPSDAVGSSGSLFEFSDEGEEED